MKSLLGIWIVCNLQLRLYSPDIGRDVVQKMQAKCLVIDDAYDPVGLRTEPLYPMLVDCRKDIMWLKPKGTDGLFIFFKGTGECNE